MVSKDGASILAAMANGWQLKSHRDIDGNKEFRLHSTQKEYLKVKASIVQELRRKGFIDSNKKFPVSTFWLTGGKELTADETDMSH